MANKLIYVKWMDAATLPGWRDVKTMELSPLACETVGWVVEETDKFITVAGTRADENDDVNCVMSIPKGWIVKRKYLKL